MLKALKVTKLHNTTQTRLPAALFYEDVRMRRQGSLLCPRTLQVRVCLPFPTVFLINE